MSTIMWLLGFGLMMGSFGFLFGKGGERSSPRISVDPFWPDLRYRDEQPPVK